MHHFKEYSFNCGQKQTNYFDDEKYSKQFCEICYISVCYMRLYSKIELIAVIKAECSASLLQSSVSRDLQKS